MIFLTNFFFIVFKILIYYKDSLDTFNGKSSESTTPFTNLKYLGNNSLKSSDINTLLTYNFKLDFSSSGSVYYINENG